LSDKKVKNSLKYFSFWCPSEETLCESTQMVFLDVKAQKPL